jgi:Zn-finger nucleic acid-binding protein
MSILKCPLCPGSILVKHEVNGTIVDFCESCGGIWLAKGELNKITHPHDGDIEFCSHENKENSVVTNRLCPVCDNKRLIQDNFIEYSDIKIEYCKCCGGIWLDKGELDTINKEIDSLKDIPETFDHKLMVFLSKLPFN